MNPKDTPDVSIITLASHIRVALESRQSNVPLPYRSMLEVVVDVSLQAGMRYDTVVAPRVHRAATKWPGAKTIFDVLDLIDAQGIQEVLSWRDARKCQVALRLCDFCFSHKMYTVGAAREFLVSPCRRERLEAVYGVGPKSSAYFARIVGVDCVAIDRHLLRFITRSVGFSVSTRDARKLINAACDFLNQPRSHIDYAIWSLERNSVLPKESAAGTSCESFAA